MLIVGAPPPKGGHFCVWFDLERREEQMPTKRQVLDLTEMQALEIEAVNKKTPLVGGVLPMIDLAHDKFISSPIQINNSAKQTK